MRFSTCAFLYLDFVDLLLIFVHLVIFIVIVVVAVVVVIDFLCEYLSLIFSIPFISAL